MNGYPKNGNGERHDSDTAAADTPVVSQEAALLSHLSQRYPETNRDDEQKRFSAPREHYSTTGMSNQTLEHALASLDITGLDARQNPLLDSQWRSQASAQNQGMNDYLYASSSNAIEFEQNDQFERLLQNNSSVNGSNLNSGNVDNTNTVRNPSVHMLNNGFLNGNLGAAPYIPRNNFIEQNDQFERLLQNNSSVNGSNLDAGNVDSTNTVRNPLFHRLNNGFLNENLGAAPYFPRNHFSDQWSLASTNGLGPGINGTDTSPPLHMLNNGFLNGNLGAAPFFPRNHFMDQWSLASMDDFGPGINGLDTNLPVHMLNNGFSSGNLGAAPYFPRNHSIDQWPLGFTNGLGPGINGVDTSPLAHKLNNGFLNGNFGDVPYPPRNHSVHQWPLASTNGYGSHRIPPVHIPNNGSPNRNLGYVPYNLPRASSVDQRTLASTNGLGRGNNGSIRINGSFISARLTEEILSGSLVSKAKSPITSSRLQTIIEEGSRTNIDKIFNEVIYYICDLMVDSVAHYVIQKLIEQCSVVQINRVLDMVLENPLKTVSICVNSLGTRSIQLLLQRLQSEEQILRTVEALSLQILDLARSNNSKYVIMECFKKFSILQNMRLFEEISNNCYNIAIDQHGCCMLQHCLRLELPELKQILLYKIIPHALSLSADNFGNYVVQYLMEMEDEGVIYDLMSVLNGNYAFLAQNKYGSHTVQKLLKVNGLDTTLIVHELLDAINVLVFDQFGNYVIQTAWDVSKEDVRMKIRFCLQKHIKDLSCHMYGKKMLDKIRF